MPQTIKSALTPNDQISPSPCGGKECPQLDILLFACCVSLTAGHTESNITATWVVKRSHYWLCFPFSHHPQESPTHTVKKEYIHIQSLCISSHNIQNYKTTNLFCLYFLLLITFLALRTLLSIFVALISCTPDVAGLVESRRTSAVGTSSFTSSSSLERLFSIY